MKSSVYINQPARINNLALEPKIYNELLLVDKTSETISTIKYSNLNSVIHKNIIVNNANINKTLIPNIKQKSKGVLNLYIRNHIHNNVYNGIFINTNTNKIAPLSNGTIIRRGKTTITVLDTIGKFRVLEITNIDDSLQEHLPSYLNKTDKDFIIKSSTYNTTFKPNASTYPDFDKNAFNLQRIELYVDDIVKHNVYNYSDIFKRNVLRITNDLDFFDYPISYYEINNAESLNEIHHTNPLVIGIDALLALETNFSHIKSYHNNNDIIKEKYSMFNLTKYQLLSHIPIHEYDKFILNGFIGSKLTNKIYQYINTNNINIGIFGQLMLIK